MIWKLGNKVLYGRTSLKEDIELEYYKTSDGIEVIKKQYIEEEPILESTKAKYNGSAGNLEKILNLLKRNKVTPITLQDVMCDLEKVYN